MPTTAIVEQLNADAEMYDHNPAWADSDEFIARMFQAWPRNDDLWTVRQKVVALDGLYGTQFGQWQGWHDVARHIVSLSPSLDEHFGVGSLEAVEMIRRIPRTDGTMRNAYVFATKYAHWHNPAAYPIYDTFAADWALPWLAERTPGVDAQAFDRTASGLVTTRQQNFLRDYLAFKKTIDKCRATWVPNWSYKQLDKALWVRGMTLKAART